ncbi:MAG: TlpA family protein disulfide reductase [Candidatus Sungbacteria bacterium]|uniref:TlpA family protein disulfide reductase n=1 Tax=Candidatus Sungiibacteriota bacterium TaxID=2750080 RepID=A0A932QYG2_9BACT|nr:TlpA family protein disulfide reductase [Candidatus Sungbacteria bacterium]
MKKKLLALLAALLVLAAGTAGVFFIRRLGERPPKTPGLARMLPYATLKDTGGKKIIQSDVGGKPVVIVIWASWCTPCMTMLETAAAMQKEFGDAIRVVALNRREPAGTAETPGSNISIPEGLVSLWSPDDAFYASLGGFAMPEEIFADENGAIRFQKRGVMNKEEMRRRIQDLLRPWAAHL